MIYIFNFIFCQGSTLTAFWQESTFSFCQGSETYFAKIYTTRIRVPITISIMFGVAFWINRIFLCNLGSAHWHLWCKMAEKTRENIFLSSGSQRGYPEKSHHACITGLVNFFGKWEVEIIPLKLSVYPRGLIMKLSPIVQDDHGGRAAHLGWSTA